MSTIKALYRQPLFLLTDLYQLTMAYSYFKSGIQDREAVFHLFFRKTPFANGFAIACGLRYTLDLLTDFRFEESDLAFLAELTGHDNDRLFSNDFIEYLREMKFQCHIDAVPEGTIVYPHEPLLRITGPIIQCQLLETVLLNLWNFQTLIATKAARIRQSAGDKPVMEFGARRAQGPDGSLTGSWAAHIGGCDSTSNVLASKLFGIPAVGTHAHSWVMCFDSEEEAFSTYAKAMPNNCVFLVDTYDTLDGVRNAIKIGNELKADGHKLIGIRLDSGDLNYLSIEARKLLDAAGFADAKIIASNDLDENIIASLVQQHSAIDVWGVGTKLITAYDQPALGGVYKLAAIREPGKEWQYRIKLSEQTAKISTPGIQQVRRFTTNGLYAGDCIFDINDPPASTFVIVDPMDMTRRRRFTTDSEYQDLLVPVLRSGRPCYVMPQRTQIKEYVKSQIDKLHPTVRRLLNPHEYPVGLEQGLYEKRTQLIMAARGHTHLAESPSKR